MYTIMPEYTYSILLQYICVCWQNVPTLKVKKIVPGKRFKRVNGYNLFFSHYVRKNSEMSPGEIFYEQRRFL